MSNDHLSSPGARLRWLRENWRDDHGTTVGLTQTELAKRAGVSQPSLSQYESDTFVPDRAKRNNLATVLGVPAEFIWTRDDVDRWEARRQVAA